MGLGWTLFMALSHIGFLFPPLLFLYINPANLIIYARPIVLSIAIFTISMSYHFCVDEETHLCYGKTIDEMYVLDNLVSLTVISEFIVTKLKTKYKDLISVTLFYIILISVMLGSRYDLVGFSIVVGLVIFDLYLVFPYFGVHPLVVEAVTLLEYIFFITALLFKYYQDDQYELWHPLWHIFISLALVCNVSKWTYIHSAFYCNELFLAGKSYLIRQNSALTHEMLNLKN